MNILDKLRNQPLYIRKIILWSVVVFIGLILVILWFLILKKNIQKFQKEKFIEGLNLPSFEEELKGLPSIEMPKLSEEELNPVRDESLNGVKKMEEEIKKLEKSEKEGKKEENGQDENSINPN